MKTIYEALELEELYMLYGYPMPTNRQFFQLMNKIALNGLGIYDELETVHAYKMIYHDYELKEDLIKAMLKGKFEKQRKKDW